MLLHSVEMQGIKGFSQTNVFNFQPGLNIVYGPNQSGKTTIQETIFHLLFTDVNSIDGEKQKSWLNKNVCQARLIYEKESSQLFRLTKDFMQKKTLLEEKSAEGWKIVAHDLKVNSLVKKHWDITDKKVFQQLFFLRQKSLTHLDRIPQTKINDLLISLVLGKDDLFSAGSWLKEQWDILKESYAKVQENYRFWQEEEIKQNNCLKEMEEREKALALLNGKEEEEEKNLAQIDQFFENYYEKVRLGERMDKLVEEEKLLRKEIEEVEGWQRRVKILEEEIELLEKQIGEVSLTTLHNWQETRKNQQSNQVRLAELLEIEEKKKEVLRQKIEIITQDDYLANFGQRSLEEIGKIDQALQEESLELERTKFKEKILKNRVRWQKIISALLMSLLFCLLPWQWWIGGIALAASGGFLTFFYQGKMQKQAQEHQEFIMQLNGQRINILENFFCSSKEELKEKVERYLQQEQEISLKMQELEFQKEKISNLEKERNLSLDKLEKIEHSLNNLYERTGLRNLEQIIILRQEYERKIAQKKDWHNRIWGKLKGQSLEELHDQLAVLLGKKEVLLGHLESGSVPFPLTQEEIHYKKEEEKLCREKLRQLRKEKVYYQAQLLSSPRYALLSENKAKDQLNYWAKELEVLEDKIALLVNSIQEIQAKVEKGLNKALPKLEKKLQEYWHFLTNTPNLQMKIKDNLDLLFTNQGIAVPLENLSLGTLAQMYFSLRLAIGQAVSSITPFFLDDVLVNFDGTARMRTMQYLAKLAQERQVFLFTHDLQDALPIYGNVIELSSTPHERRLEVS